MKTIHLSDANFQRIAELKQVFLPYMKDRLIEFHNSPHSLGSMAEDNVVEGLRSTGLKFMKARSGSTADVIWKVDVIVFFGSCLVLTQIKAGDGLKDTHPWLPKKLAEPLHIPLKPKVLKVNPRADISPADLLRALQSKSLVEWLA